jgi:predicted permease
MTDYLPMTNFGAGIMFDIEGRPATRIEDQKFSWSTVVGGRFFDAMGIPVVRGRVPGDDDWTVTRPVVVIDEKLARQYWANADPVGAHISAQLNGKTFVAEIIGVVGSVRWQTTSEPPPAMIYWWFASVPARDLSIVVRATGNASALIGPITAQLRSVDPDQPVSDVRALDAIVAADLARPRFTLVLLGAFAAAALLLTAVGLYGLIAFAVNQRRPEIGVRIALGAQASDVVLMLLRRGVVLVAVGVAAGLIGEVAVERFVAGLLYGVRASDPATWFVAAATVIAIAMLASYLPARRASRVDPMIALKAD